jgi:hypothetical protein
MQNEPEVAPRANGLATLLNIIASPKEAFETLRVAPTWGWAFIVAAVLGVIGSILMLPAARNAFDAQWAVQLATNPDMAQMSPDKAAQMKSISAIFVSASPAFVVIAIPIFTLIETAIMLIFNAVSHGVGTFKTLWASAMNIAVIAMLGSLVTGVIVVVRGADSFQSQIAVQGAMPSLAMLAPHAGKLTNFLGAFTPFSIWSTILTVIAMLTVARVSKVPAWLTGGVIILIPALFTLLAPGQ